MASLRQRVCILLYILLCTLLPAYIRAQLSFCSDSTHISACVCTNMNARVFGCWLRACIQARMHVSLVVGCAGADRVGSIFLSFPLCARACVCVCVCVCVCASVKHTAYTVAGTALTILCDTYYAGAAMVLYARACRCTVSMQERLWYCMLALAGVLSLCRSGHGTVCSRLQVYCPCV